MTDQTTEFHTQVDQYNSIIETLRAASCEIKFTKKDGSVRKMLGTLKPELLPQRTYQVDEAVAISAHAPNFNTVKVFDLEANAWRSFSMQSLISIALSDK